MRRIVSALLLAVFAFPVFVGIATAQSASTTITILQTSDLHANLMPWDYYSNRTADWGISKVATLIKQERAKDPNLLLLDSGDTTADVWLFGAIALSTLGASLILRRKINAR